MWPGDAHRHLSYLPGACLINHPQTTNLLPANRACQQPQALDVHRYDVANALAAHVDCARFYDVLQLALQAVAMRTVLLGVAGTASAGLDRGKWW